MLTRDAAAEVRASVTCAPVTRTVRGIASEVQVGSGEGLDEPCVINCDNVMTIPKRSLDPSPTGRLDEIKRAELDHALRYALDILY